MRAALNSNSVWQKAVSIVFHLGVRCTRRKYIALLIGRAERKDVRLRIYFISLKITSYCSRATFFLVLFLKCAGTIIGLVFHPIRVGQWYGSDGRRGECPA